MSYFFARYEVRSTNKADKGTHLGVHSVDFEISAGARPGFVTRSEEQSAGYIIWSHDSIVDANRMVFSASMPGF
ncbi:MAG: hypothetical protein DWI00_09565 [Planctomycetota bacterium]|nr:MAG: hypothetical protein DWI00_09565 [Planctomycetota bacterium]